MKHRLAGFFAAIFMCTVLFTACTGVDTGADNEARSVTLSRAVFGELNLSGYVFTYGTRCEDIGFVQEIYRFLDDLNQKISTKETSSYIYKFNHGEGGERIGFTSRFRYEIDSHAYAMLTKAERLNTETGGYFDPTVYPLMRLWGLRSGEWNDSSKHSGERLPNPSGDDYSVETVKRLYCGLDKVTVLEENGKYYAVKDRSQDIVTDGELWTTMLDFGAQAKGYAADRIRDILNRYDQVIGASFSISGNAYMTGYYPSTLKKGGKYYKTGEQNFITGIIDPSVQNIMGSPLVGFEQDARQGVSAVTSGDYERRFYLTDGGYWDGYSALAATPSEVTYFCHIIDPLTGLPCNIDAKKYYPSTRNKYVNKAEGALTSVTVLHQSSELADVYATAVMLMGMTDGIAWMERNGVRGFLIGCDARYADLTRAEVMTDREKGYTFSIAGYVGVDGYAIGGGV